MKLADLLTKWWLIASDTISLEKPTQVTESDGSTHEVLWDEQSVEVGYRLGFVNALQIVGAGACGEPVEDPDELADAIAQAVALEAS